MRRKILSTLMRRAYRRPIAEAGRGRADGVLSRGRAPAGFRRRHRAALSAVLINPEFLFRVESDPKKVRQAALPHQRSRAGVATVVLPVEQHSGRRAARRGRSRAS